MSKKNLSYFIDKFAAIPEDKWTTGAFYRPSSDTYCALGHLGVRTNLDKHDELRAEGKVLEALLFKHTKGKHYIPDINDNLVNAYRAYGKTPKQRVVNFLTELRTKVNQEKKMLKKQVKATKKDVKQLFTEIMGKAGLDKSDNVVERVMQELQTVDWGKK